jgi:hypothetical protein
VYIYFQLAKTLATAFEALWILKACDTPILVLFKYYEIKYPGNYIDLNLQKWGIYL